MDHGMPKTGIKDLEQENARLKSLVADLSLDKAILKEALDHLGKQ
jgi:hypothetical protein